MSTLKLRKDNKRLLKNYTNGNYDEIINKLIDDVEEQLPLTVLDYAPPTSIKINEDTLERISKYKITPSESYENILVRMMIQAQNLNNTGN